MKGLEIRQFRLEDTDAVLNVWRACGVLERDRRPRITIQKKLAHSPESFFIGVLSGEVVATVLVGYDGLRGWIYRLAVRPALQRKGIGRRMVEHAEAWLRGQGCIRVKLQVEPGGPEAVAFYRRLGYEVQELIDMSKWLEAEDGSTAAENA